MTEEKELLFTIKNRAFSDLKNAVLNPDGSPAYSIRKDPAPLDSRDKYIFTDHTSKNEFFAWVERNLFHRVKNNSVRSIFFFSPLEIFIEAESFFGELCIKRGGISEFDIFLNGSKQGIISKKRITCDIIDDPALLAVLYVFTNYIARKEEICRAADST
jgi:hypothetical protein